MAFNPAAASRRARERDRKRKKQEKLAARKARREEKKGEDAPATPEDDPMIDWSEAVREEEIPVEEEEQAEEAV